MPAKQYHVVLSEEQRLHLEKVVNSTRTSIRQRIHARILLLADANQEGGARRDDMICEKVRTSLSTVGRVRQRFAQAAQAGEAALKVALEHKAQEKRKARKLDGVGEAHLIALVCGTPPDGHKRWSLRLLQDKLVEEQVVDTISHEAVRSTLKKMNLSRGSSRVGASHPNTMPNLSGTWRTCWMFTNGLMILNDHRYA
jgi:Homeodomain-like domain